MKRSWYNLSVIVVSLLTFVPIVKAGPPGPQDSDSKLGQVVFPTSGGSKAQAHFIRGLAALHSFWFEEAVDEFRASTKAEPDFMMGYWGEAMALNHPLWAEQDTDGGRKVVEKIKDQPKLSARERAYLNAVKVLYGQGDKLQRDNAYAKVMEKLYRDYPDDLEAASLYSLSLLGTVRPGDKGFQRQMKAGAIALEVYEKNPNHPGAAHYIIHSFDDPEHAILALPAAFRYAEIAPSAHHARHMPSHIFLQLGMWPEAVRSNESAWKVSDEWVKRKNLNLSARDYHSFHWLAYSYLQQGRYGKAEEVIKTLRKTVEDAGETSIRAYADVVAHFIIETERWELANNLFTLPTSTARPAAQQPAEHVHGPQPQAPPAGMARRSRGQHLGPYVRALGMARSGSGDSEKALAEIRASRQSSSGGDAYGASATRQAEIRELMISAEVSAAKKDFNAAIESMKRATSLEEDMSPPSGPPDLIKPTHELFGEILLKAGKPQEAAKQFEVALQRQPNRARSLLGSARAATAAGDTQKATEAYSTFLRHWKDADKDLPELREAQNALKGIGARR